MSAHDAYRALAGVNWSTLKEMGRSPLHYQHALQHPREATDAMTFGSAVHVAILEPREFGDRYAIWEGGRRAGKVWDEFRAAAERNGLDVLRAEDQQKVHDLASAVRANPTVMPYLDGPGSFEATVRWEDHETGVDCKGRVDRLAESIPCTGRVLVDLKTARDANPRIFGVQAARLGYHAQLAFYTDGLAANGCPVDKVVVVLVESSPPYDSGVVVLDDDALWAGRCVYRGHLRRLVECAADGRWPGRYQDETALTLPAWAFSDPNGPADDPAFGLDMGEE